MRNFSEAVLTALVAVAMLTTLAVAAKNHMAKSGAFAGAKANTGFVDAMRENGKLVLRLSDDFVVPDTPAPHWQLVNSKGNTIS